MKPAVFHDVKTGTRLSGLRGEGYGYENGHRPDKHVKTLIARPLFRKRERVAVVVPLRYVSFCFLCRCGKRKWRGWVAVTEVCTDPPPSQARVIRSFYLILDASVLGKESHGVWKEAWQRRAASDVRESEHGRNFIIWAWVEAWGKVSILNTPGH